MRKFEAGSAPEWRYWPHIIGQGAACNVRHDVHVTNEPLNDDGERRHAAYSFSHPDAVDADGTVTMVGRRAIVDELRRGMHANDEMCVVWGPRDCTYVMRRGTMDSDDPPEGQPNDPNAVARLRGLDFDGAVLTLPSGCAASHLFIRRLAHDRVEIATAAPRILHDDEGVRPGEADPLAAVRGDDGRAATPRWLMGSEVSGEREGAILGPVQPDGMDRIVVVAWPSAVAEACIELAGRPIDSGLVNAAWRAAERLPRPMIGCGAIFAA